VLTLQWHGDTFDLPEGAVRLAGSPVCPNQAFRVGRAYGDLFHLEASAEMGHEWAEAPEYVSALERTLGAEAAGEFLASVAERADEMQTVARALFEPARPRRRTRPGGCGLTPRPHYVVAGTGVRGLTTAVHLAELLGSGESVIVLDKSRVGAGASGVSGGTVRNFYLSPEMNEIARRSVEIFALGLRVFGSKTVGADWRPPALEGWEKPTDTETPLSGAAPQASAIRLRSREVHGQATVTTSRPLALLPSAPAASFEADTNAWLANGAPGHTGPVGALTVTVTASPALRSPRSQLSSSRGGIVPVSTIVQVPAARGSTAHGPTTNGARTSESVTITSTAKPGPRSVAVIE
jgi:hypothetical protein